MAVWETMIGGVLFSSWIKRFSSSFVEPAQPSPAQKRLIEKKFHFTLSTIQWWRMGKCVRAKKKPFSQLGGQFRQEKKSPTIIFFEGNRLFGQVALGFFTCVFFWGGGYEMETSG